MSNMKFIYNNGAGTLNLTDNPTDYQVIDTTQEVNERSSKGNLINYHLFDYKSFILNFDYLGTADKSILGTIHSLHKNIDFYPMDENIGTSVFYTVRWIGNFESRLVSSFWSSGFSLSIVFEEV